MRAEAHLQRAVLQALRWDPRVRADDVGVSVHEGVVTLSGRVSSLAEKDAAHCTARRVSGMCPVANALVVVCTPAPCRRDDADLARAAADALAWNRNVPAGRVRVAVRDGWITLQGEVDWQYQREAAFNSVAHLRGVRAVVNDVVPRPRAKIEMPEMALV